MSKKITVILIFSLFVTNTMIGQNKDSITLNHYKRFLPFMIKGLHKASNNKKQEDLTQTVNDFFEKPWHTKELQPEKAREFLNAIDENKKFTVEKNNRGKWNLKFQSEINIPRQTLTEANNIDHRLSNVFIAISDVHLINKEKESIIDTVERRVTMNQSKTLDFHAGRIKNNLPITGDYERVAGRIHLVLKEYQTIDHAVFKPGDENLVFDLGETKGLKLIKTENNKAYFYLPKPMENIEILSTNEDGKEYVKHTKMPIPKTVYDYATGKELSKKQTKSLIDNFTVEDLSSNPQILIYITNGTIKQLYVYLKSDPMELASKTLEVKL